MQNINPETKIPYGYISASCLHSDIVDQLYYGGNNLTFQDALDEHLFNYPEEEHDEQTDTFNQQYECYEEIIEGEYEGVFYCSSWLGGALNFFITQSPFLTNSARKASPCVPNCGILDTLDGSEFSYDVPPEWRVKNEY